MPVKDLVLGAIDAQDAKFKEMINPSSPTWDAQRKTIDHIRQGIDSVRSAVSDLDLDAQFSSAALEALAADLDALIDAYVEVNSWRLGDYGDGIRKLKTDLKARIRATTPTDQEETATPVSKLDKLFIIDSDPDGTTYDTDTYHVIRTKTPPEATLIHSFGTYEEAEDFLGAIRSLIEEDD